MRVDGFAKRHREKIRKVGPGAKLTRRIVGDLMIIRFAEGQYYINPEGTDTKALVPKVERAVINMLAFSPSGRFPIPDEIVRSGIPISYEGF